MHSARVHEATAVTPKHTQVITLKGGHVARQEQLESGAVGLQEVLDVPPGRHLVLLLHLFGAARRAFGRAHLEISTLKQPTSSVRSLKCLTST